MLEGFFKFFRELDGRVKVTIAGIGIQNWIRRLSRQYNTLYSRDLGASPVQLGLLSSIGSAVGTIASVPIGWVAERYSVKRVMLLGLACVVASAAMYAVAGSWWMLIPAVILAPRLVRLNPLTDIIFITSTKPQQRATVMSLSRTIWGILNLFAPMTAAIIVASSGGINAEGIRPLYYIQLSLVLVVFGFIALKLQPLPHSIDRRTEKATSKRGMRAFIQDFRELFKGEKALKRWIMLRVIRQFGNSLSTSFTALWLVDMKGATPYILGIMSTASVLITMLLQIPAGRLSDKIGRKKAYFLLRPIAYLGTVLLILAPHPEYLILVGLLGAVGMPGGGGIGGVGNTAFITMHWEMVPREKRGRWYGVEGLMNVATIPAAIIGGILWQQGFMTAVLLLPIVIEALVVIPIMITVPDTLGRSDR